MQFSKNRSVHKETGRHGISSLLDRLSPSTSQCRVVTNISKNSITQVSQCLCACVWLRGIFCRSKVVKTRHAGLSCFILRFQIWHNWKPLYHCNEIPLMFLASHLFWQAEYDSLSHNLFFTNSIHGYCH